MKMKEIIFLSPSKYLININLALYYSNIECYLHESDYLLRFDFEILSSCPWR